MCDLHHEFVNNSIWAQVKSSEPSVDFLHKNGEEKGKSTAVCDVL